VIETPVEPDQAAALAGKKLVFAPILRAGEGCSRGCWT
jgi:uracil phosphoribosyltransferase